MRRSPGSTRSCLTLQGPFSAWPELLMPTEPPHLSTRGSQGGLTEAAPGSHPGKFWCEWLHPPFPGALRLGWPCGWGGKVGPPGWDLRGQWGRTCLALFLQPLLLSLRSGGYPVLAWVPSANPGHASEQVLGEGCPQQGALGLQHELRGALDGETPCLSPLVFNRAALHCDFSLSLYFFICLGSEVATHWSLVALQHLSS